MFTTYQEALEWIHARLRLGIKPGLKRMEWMMEKLGNPEKELKTVHIGGTNGKGSTVTFLRSILQAGGYTIGTFTSPYIEQFNERISVNGIPISDEDIIRLTNVIRPLADEMEETEFGGPTEFEVVTAMSFYYFSKLHPVDIVLFEVGLGGRFDSTNIISPLLSIITNIGLDHTNILGNSYEDIAFEKAGIIKRDTPIITAAKQPGALKVIKEQALKMNAPLFRINQEFTISSHKSLARGESFTVNINGDQTMDQLEIAMIGQHQTENAALAVIAGQYLNQISAVSIDNQDIRVGLKHAFWPGRFEVISENPLVIIDGAHNDEGVTALVHELSSRFKGRMIHIVFAALKDKKLDKMIGSLDEIAEQITFVSFDYPRAASANDLFELSQSSNKSVGDEWETTITQELTDLPNDHLLVITGSLYFISRVKPLLFKYFQNKIN
ncbi:folylpolyglutamate synthase/dihydrofolate synthase family protein [Neobacillus sp. PS3-40]|uniref:bifunctional folylpolyglutamate synthase/dihydrofolate synthase n=1 Tax=Neobacillus sp. PS3-40 TaxID=3070679 RepID=UPI0027E18C71|nr:folylpolyglutamate synthase/dihydrofolate synthase family protein [Neobacillus sp. PS3-40]WML45563.1 folylpolyglutamate synthase/dihydrofolate synthase family protein [Neobacillus sp. PS3-40]